MKRFVVLALLLVQYHLYSQNNAFNEKPPVFPSCESATIDALQRCFDTNVYTRIFDTFKVPETVSKENYKGDVVVIFEVDTTGQFKVIYVDAMYDTLKTEVKRVFSTFPQITPATYNGSKTYKQYAISIKIPLVNQAEIAQNVTKETAINRIEQQAKAEFERVNHSLKTFEDSAFSSQLNIPFTHSDYARFDRNMNLVGTNSHTASKPFVYEDVANYYDFKVEKKQIAKRNHDLGRTKTLE